MTTSETRDLMREHAAALERLNMTQEDCIRICAKLNPETRLYWALPHALELWLAQPANTHTAPLQGHGEGK